MKQVFYSIAILLFLVLSVYPEWVQMSGPYGGKMEALAASGTTVLVATQGGNLYRSTDNGDSWNIIYGEPNGKEIVKLLADRDDFFALVRPVGVYHSSDSGATWTEISETIGTRSTKNKGTLAKSDSVFFVDTDSLYRTADFGKNWYTVVDSALNNSTITSFTKMADTIFAGTDNGIFYSVDGGISWSEDATSPRLIDAILAVDKTLYVGAGPGYIYRRIAGETSWTEISSDFEKQSLVSLNKYDDFLLAECDAGGILVSFDNGVTWAFRNAKVSNRCVKAVDGDATTLFSIYINGEGVYRSIDKGITWVPCNTGITDAAVIDLTAGRDVLYAKLSSGGWYKTADKGENWNFINEGLPMNDNWALAAIGTVLFAVAQEQSEEGRIYRSTDGGGSWVALDSLFPYDISSGTLAAAVDGNCLYIGSGCNANHCGVFRTDDFGESWGQVSSSLNNTNSSLNISFSLTTLEVEGNTIVGAQSADEFCSSFDGGASWKIRYKKPGLGIDLPSPRISALAIINSAAIYSTGRETFFTIDSGSSWNQMIVGTDSTEQILSFTKAENTLFAGSYSSLYYSTDNAQTWSAMTETGPEYFYSLLVDNDTLYAGCYGGVWYRPVAGILDETPNVTQPAVGSTNGNAINVAVFPSSQLAVNVTLSRSDRVTVTLFDLSGKKLAVSADRKLPEGASLFHHTIRGMAEKCLLVRVQTSTETLVKKVAVLR